MFAHSLGCVILHDILCNWKADGGGSDSGEASQVGNLFRVYMNYFCFAWFIEVIWWCYVALHAAVRYYF